MNKLWLKITGISVLTLAAIVVVTAFWPTETAQLAESKDMKQIQKEGEGDFKTQQTARRPKEKQAVEPDELKQLETIDQAESDTKAEKLYQIALFYNESGNSPDVTYKIVVDCCQRILKEYPNSSHVEKARELLQKVPEQYLKQYDEETSFLYPTRPKVEKSRSLRRRPPRRGDGWRIATNDEINPSN